MPGDHKACTYKLDLRVMNHRVHPADENRIVFSFSRFRARIRLIARGSARGYTRARTLERKVQIEIKEFRRHMLVREPAPSATRDPAKSSCNVRGRRTESVRA